MKTFREFITDYFIESIKTPIDFAIELNKQWKERYGVNSMSGNCGKISSILIKRMHQNGYYDCEQASGEFKGYPGNHGWVEWNNHILDPSVHQFGAEHPVISKVGDERYIKHRSAIISKNTFSKEED